MTPLSGFWRCLFPRKASFEERLAAFPTQGLPLDAPAVIFWNRHLVPWVFCETDKDLAFVLGLIHMHLRQAQLALFKRLVQGRLSEMAGPWATDIDHVLRLLDFGKAVPAIWESMPSATRIWLQAFADGLNFCEAHAKELPPELAMLGIKRETWHVFDIIAMGRLAGADVNWLMYFLLLPERNRPGWPSTWQKMKEAGMDSALSFRFPSGAALARIFLEQGRPGSNAVAVSRKKSATGASLLACDPHLGVLLPNAWILAGMRSPSFKVVGFMPVGLPVVALGRNMHIAWGGTNMRALASDLFDASAIEEKDMFETPLAIRRRFWFSARRKHRLTPFGPLLTDAGVFPSGGMPLALSWVGHHPSDEFTALLDAARAENFEAFCKSFAPFAISGQNMLYADTQGHIGQILAARIPKRSNTLYPDLVRDPQDQENLWHGFYGSLDLPFTFDPDGGFLASANNKPTETEMLLGLFFTNSDRVSRLQEALREKEKITLQDLSCLQRDTRSIEAKRLAQTFYRMLQEAGGQGEFFSRLAAWDGDYASTSEGAVAFEILLFHVVLALYLDGRREATSFFTQWGFLSKHLISDLEALPKAKRDKMLKKALALAEKKARRYRNWGEMHYLDIAHMFSLIPVLGRRFRLQRLATGGSRETPMKTSHRLGAGPLGTDYGSQARQLCDLSHPDENYFVLLGGQDGFWGSDRFADQIPLWRQGQSIRMPLLDATVEKEFSRQMRLMPKKLCHDTA